MKPGRTPLPWTETDARREQERFITAYLERRESFASLCRGFGISRKTGYKRVRRFTDFGYQGLGDLSRAPHSRPNRISPEVEEMVLSARIAHPMSLATLKCAKVAKWN